MDTAMDRPYLFEPPPSGHFKVQEDGKQGEIKRHLLGELTWPEAKARFEEVDVALLPVGAIEQHGPHLPLDCDAFDADYLAKAVAEYCDPPRPLVLPLVSYGVSYHHEDFSGTLSVNPETPFPDGLRYRHERRTARYQQAGKSSTATEETARHFILPPR